MKPNSGGAVLSKSLLSLIENLSKSHFAAEVIFDSRGDLAGGDWNFFDLSPEGAIICTNQRHKAEISVFKWIKMVLTDTYYEGGQELLIRLEDYFNVLPYEIEQLGNYIKGICAKNNYTIDILAGTEVKRVLTISRVDHSRLGESCMNGPMKSRYFDMLARSGDFRIVAMFDDRKNLVGRSWLWSVDIGSDKKIEFMDRFYTARDFLDGSFMDFALEQGFWRKQKYYTSEDHQKWVAPDLTLHKIKGSVSLECEGFKYYPYLDTFFYGNSDFLSNSSYNAKYFYQNINGTRTTTISQ